MLLDVRPLCFVFTMKLSLLILNKELFSLFKDFNIIVKCILFRSLLE